MIAAVAIAVVLAQLVGLTAFGWFIFEMITLPQELLDEAAGNLGFANQLVEETIASYRAWWLTGVVGAMVGWLLIFKSWCRDAWFLATTRVLAWIWLLFFPVGTVIGALVLYSRAKALKELADGQR